MFRWSEGCTSCCPCPSFHRRGYQFTSSHLAQGYSGDPSKRANLEERSGGSKTFPWWNWSTGSNSEYEYQGWQVPRSCKGITFILSRFVARLWHLILVRKLAWWRASSSQVLCIRILACPSCTPNTHKNRNVKPGYVNSGNESRQRTMSCKWKNSRHASVFFDDYNSLRRTTLSMWKAVLHARSVRVMNCFSPSSSSTVSSIHWHRNNALVCWVVSFSLKRYV